jgi:hypothetical protein
MDAWVVIKDRSEGRCVHKSSLVREKFWRKATSKDRTQRVRSMYGGAPLAGMESTAGNKLERMVCKGDPLSTLVKVSCRSVLNVVHVTRFVDSGHEAPFSLLRSTAFAAGTIVHADVLQLLPFGGVEDDTRWQWDGRRILACWCPALRLPLSSLRWHRGNIRMDMPMATCVTYELPGSLLKLSYDEGVSAIEGCMQEFFRGSRVPLSQSYCHCCFALPPEWSWDILQRGIEVGA